MREVVRWPLRDALLAYRERLKARALEEWRLELLIWAIQSPYMKSSKRAPRPPKILRGPPDADA